MILVYKNGNMIGGDFVSATRTTTTFQPMVASENAIKLDNKDRGTAWALTNRLEAAYEFCGAHYPTDEEVKKAEDAKKLMASAIKPHDWAEKLKTAWRGHGGEFHGPCVETATMSETNWLSFMWGREAAAYVLAAAVTELLNHSASSPAARELRQLIVDLDLAVPKPSTEPKLQTVDLDFYAKTAHRVTNEDRLVFVRTGKGWQQAYFADIQVGGIFCLFEPDGKPVVLKGSTTLVAVGEPYFDQSTSAPVWGILCEPHVDKE